MGQVRLVSIDRVLPARIVDVVNRAFGRRLTLDWFQWKHREGPWGPSIGCAALDASGSVVGVRLLLPWLLRRHDESMLALRAVEAATVPAARGRGVFRAMNEHEMARLANQSERRLIFSTPNENSRPAYLRMGWLELAPIAHAYSPPPLRCHSPQVLVSDVHTVSWPQHVASDRILTSWTADALRWRFDPRSGNSYTVLTLGHGSAPAGIVYRAVRVKLPSLLVAFSWGEPADQRALIRAAAARERAVAVLQPTGAGAADTAVRPRWRRGASKIVLWDNHGVQAGLPWPVYDTSEWSLRLADLESAL
jgi:hypothetical protein